MSLNGQPLPAETTNEKQNKKQVGTKIQEKKESQFTLCVLKDNYSEFGTLVKAGFTVNRDKLSCLYAEIKRGLGSGSLLLGCTSCLMWWSHTSLSSSCFQARLKTACFAKHVSSSLSHLCWVPVAGPLMYTGRSKQGRLTSLLVLTELQTNRDVNRSCYLKLDSPWIH